MAVERKGIQLRLGEEPSRTVIEAAIKEWEDSKEQRGIRVDLYSSRDDAINRALRSNPAEYVDLENGIIKRPIRPREIDDLSDGVY